MESVAASVFTSNRAAHDGGDQNIVISVVIGEGWFSPEWPGRVRGVGWGGGFQFREGTCETSTNCFLVTRQWPTTMEHGLGTDYIISINTSVSTPITPLEILS